MARLTIKQKNGQTIVKTKLEWAEKINERELQVFHTKLIRGLVRPNVEGKKITYTVPADISLQKYLKSGITKKEFFLIIAQIIELTKKIEKYSLNINNLILNSQYVFMNQMTKEIQFVYRPVITMNISASVYSFVSDIAYSAVFELSEDTSFVNDFMRFLHSMEGYSSEELEKYILKKHPETYKMIKREQPKSTVLQNKKWYAQAQSGSLDTEMDMPTSLLEENYGDDTETGLLVEDEDDLSTGLLVEDEDDLSTGLLMEDEDDLSTGLLIEDEDDLSTGLLVEEDEMETTLLMDEEPQTLLFNEQVVRYPYIIRLTSYEQVEVNKPVFRIGKERSYVDFFVANNNAVSRLHADIIERNGSYYIRDNNSTNHTYVNGNIVSPGLEVEIHEGDLIMLANESFEFHW